MTEMKNKVIGNAVKATREQQKAFRYYNYVREFYGYLLDSIGWSLEPEDASFNPATASAEKVFTPGVDEKIATSKEVAADKCARAIAAYERMIEVVTAWSVEKYEQEKEKREWGLQDPEKFALTSIAEMLLMPAIWYEFDVRSQKELAKLGDDAQSDVMLMDALSLEDHISKLFAKQKGCLDEFLPRKLEELKKLQAEAGA
jgi:hypothetical protein